MKIQYLIFALLILLLSSSLVTAQIGITLGNEYGFGLVAQLGTSQAKLEAGAGFLPLLVYWNITVIGAGSSSDYLVSVRALFNL